MTVTPSHPSDSVTPGEGGIVFRIRLWLMDKALAFGGWVEPEYRYQSKYSDDGQTIYLWREPA